MTRYLKKNCKHELVGVEIGVQYANNALSMLYNLPIKKLYLVDPYLKYNDYTNATDHSKWIDSINQNDFDEIFDIAKRKLKRYNNKIEFLRQQSEYASDKIPNNLDFVYIDGNHKFDYVLKDIEIYYPKLKKGGVIGGHDWDARMNVWKAVHYFITKHHLKLDGRVNDWWVIK